MTAMLTFSGDPALLPGGLRTRLQRWLANRYGQAQSWHIDLIRSAGKRGRNRRILRARNAQGYAIAVKSHDSRLRNRREYHALRKLHDTMSDSIAPIYLAHDCKYYAMEWVDGPLLSRSLGQSDHAVRIAQTGQWLARLHAHATPRRLCETRLPDLQLPWRRGSGEIAVATTRLKQRLRTLERASGPRAVLHGDFHAGNLFILPDRVMVFDREEDGFGLTFLDVARFLVDLAQRRRDAAAAGDLWAGDEARDRRLFFDAYGPIRAQDLAVYDAIEDALAFRSWRRQMRRGQSAMTPDILARGLLGDDSALARPPRLVAGRDGALSWTQAPADALAG